tara:strand:+ start:436 stop:633 length:198 start_codon:yes stop_codon:yes gene_type:complete
MGVRRKLLALMKRINKIVKKMKKLQSTMERENMRKQGAFDGRYNTKSVPSKKVYKRNKKHKNKYE